MRPVEVTITLDNDPDTSSPSENDLSWKIVTFGNKLITDGNPEEYCSGLDESGEPIPATLAIRNKLKAGSAFWLSYFEHGNSVYSIMGTGPQCRWDNVRVAGIVLFEHNPNEIGPKVKTSAERYAIRQADCASFLAEYTQWANGECYWYRVECEEADFEDSCGGFIGSDYCLEEVASSLVWFSKEWGLTFEDLDVTWKGEAAWMSDYFKPATYEDAA